MRGGRGAEFTLEKRRGGAAGAARKKHARDQRVFAATAEMAEARPNFSMLLGCVAMMTRDPDEPGRPAM